MNYYATEYTRKERTMFVLKHLIWVLPLFAVTKFWFLPWLEGYAEVAHCYNYGEFTGIHVVFYGLFVGLPLLSAIILFIGEGPRSIKVIQLGQSPLPNEKVFTPTKYKYGVKAKIKPYIFFAILVFLLGLSVRGVFWANDIIALSSGKELPQCQSLVLGSVINRNTNDYVNQSLLHLNSSD